MTADDATFLYVDIAVLLGVLGLLMMLAGWCAQNLRRSPTVLLQSTTAALLHG